MSTEAKARDAYTRIAMRLRDLSDADREWLLGQLAPDDCKRVSAALRQHRSQALSSATSTGRPGITAGPRGAQDALANGTNGYAPTGPASAAGSGQPGDHASDDAADDPATRLMSARVEDVRPILSAQPDWAVALVLTADQWPWAQDFLGVLGPDRIRTLRAVAAELSSRVKPKMREALVRSIAARLTPPVTTVSQAIVPFDVALERATSELSGIGGLSMSSGVRGGELPNSGVSGEWRLDRI